MNHDQQMAREWLDKSTHIPYMEIEITPDSLTVNISKNADELLKFLSEEYGITYDDPAIVLCG